ncbi:DUF3306 domain-containing protein [Pseudomonadota bacterium]|uniref:DUF3306 domain-containing protein n=1 Tax=Shewanella sp. 10N.286.52.C2 TaxID=1880838 RepID=UPI000C83094D|nr:DUF3306 domain-containing protein [Shewanella sp. 10N.286.52.C2]PMG29150.1 hypothetical protein BCU94_15090 [Shewanella sp. 10N.286.52.C2]
MSNNSKGFFSRWTERREQVEAEAARETELQQKSVAAEEESLADSSTEDAIQEAPQPEKILEAEDLPDPEKIEVGGSFASFMGANVSPQAKSAALKALWKQPQYNEIDGLLEYALDYSNQPKLSAEVSAELAKKVFRNVVKDKEETEEQELLAREDDDTVVDTTDASPVLDDKSEIVSATDLDTNQDQSDVLGMVDEEAITASSSAKA